MIRILHIIDSLSGAGPTRSLISLARYARENKLNQQHKVIALKKEVYPVSLLLAKQAGVDVMRTPDRESICNEMEKSDIVQIHYWNNPTMTEFLRSDWPSMRMLIWFMVFGEHPPQVITDDLLNYSDFALATSPDTLKLPVFEKMLSEERADFVYGLADWSRLESVKPCPHDTFNVGYIGTVNFTKMHPNYIEMSAGISIPNAKYIVCGGGIEDQLKKKAAALHSAEKFEFRGYVENIRSVLETLDLFGYPLCEDTYATSEKSIQEAMYAGVPPVVFPYGGCSDLVQHKKTGMVVHNETEYREAIEFLYHNPDFRKELGRNAAEYARRAFDSEKAARKMHVVYERMMDQPKQEKRWRGSTSKEKSPSEFFVELLGNEKAEFAVSRTASDPDHLLRAEKKIASASALLVGGEGGINQYRNSYPSDPFFRLWSGLCLQKNGVHEKAIKEFNAAIEHGLTHWRVQWYKARSAYEGDDLMLAEEALREVLSKVPDFPDAGRLFDDIQKTTK